MNPTAIFSSAWQEAERTIPKPIRLRLVRFMGYAEFKDCISIAADHMVQTLVGSLQRGDVFIIRGAYPVEFMRELAVNASAWMRDHPSSFHKMVEGAPNFHRDIDLETGKKYAFPACKQAAYFYRWNADELNVWQTITERWRFIKLLMGLRADEYEANTPKDGVVDRVQIVRYPPSIGYLAPHQDSDVHQRLFCSAYMSKRGVDFHGGGFYMVGENDEVIDVEDQVGVGDICVGRATLFHGVAPCDRGEPPDWNATDGRWFLSTWSNASDEVEYRATGNPVKLELQGVMP